MVRDVSFGQYFPGNSLIHRLDPRAKLLIFIAFIVIIFCTFNYAALGVTAAFTALFLILSRIPIKFYFKSLKVIIFIVLFTSVINLFYGVGDPIWQWWVFKITWDGIHRAIMVTIRIICLILSSSCLTFTTSPTELTDAIERLMSPLRAIRFPVHEIDDVARAALRADPHGGDGQDNAGSEGERSRHGVGQCHKARTRPGAGFGAAVRVGVQAGV